MTRKLRFGVLVEEGQRESMGLWGKKEALGKTPPEGDESCGGLFLPMLVGSGINWSLRATVWGGSCAQRAQRALSLRSCHQSPIRWEREALSCFPPSFSWTCLYLCSLLQPRFLHWSCIALPFSVPLHILIKPLSVTFHMFAQTLCLQTKSWKHKNRRVF